MSGFTRAHKPKFGDFIVRYMKSGSVYEWPVTGIREAQKALKRVKAEGARPAVIIRETPPCSFCDNTGIVEAVKGEQRPVDVPCPFCE